MSKEIEIKLFATLGKVYTVPDDIDLGKARSLREILDDLNIPAQKVAVALVCGRHAELSDTVTPGDTLALFPPIGGG